MDSHGKLWFWFHDTVSALSYSSCQLYGEPADADLGPPYNDITRFILEQQAQMPDLLRRPLRAASLGFDLMGALRSGHLFHTRSPEDRQTQLSAWKKSRLGFQRDLVRYYDSLATFGLYSRRESSLKLEQASVPSFATKGVIGSPKEDLRCDVAVIGSGPGGAITACLLAEAGRDVLLVEEGPLLPPESCLPFSRQEMLTKYRHGGQTVALGRNKIAYVEGRCVGGGSEINSGLYHRTPEEVLDAWRKVFKVEALEMKDLLPHFETCERELSVSPLPNSPPAASLKLAEGAQRLGWKCIETPRWHRYGEADRAGVRQTMTRTFIPRFLDAGGRLLPETRVHGIRQENGRWSLTASHGSVAELTIAAEHVFLAAGAVQTPALLRRSGIKKNIGDSLQVHPTVKLTARFPEPVNSESMGVPVHQVKEFAPALTLGCSISSRAYLALALLDYPDVAREVSEQWRHLGNYYAMTSGGGSGTVRVIRGFQAPLVRYQLADGDKTQLAKGLRRLAEVLFESGASEIYPGVSGLKPLRTKGDVSLLPEVLPEGRSNLMTIHLFSTCPMGEDKTRCATDSVGRVHGFKKLYVADASLLCTSPGVNPQGTIMALARRNVSHFLG